MNKLVQVLLILLTPLSVLGQEVNSDQLEKKDQLYYLKGESSPYSGIAITYSKYNIKTQSITYVSGFPNGTLIGWYPDGSKQVEGNIIGMSKTGRWMAWYANGNKLREGVYKDNKEEGLFTWWYQNGNLHKKGNYANGISNGSWEWYYESGKLEQTGAIKGDTNLGKWNEYYEDGSPKTEGEFQDGKMDGTWLSWDEKGVQTIKIYQSGLLQSDSHDKNSYVEKMNYFLGELDFKNALINIEKAMETVSNKTEDNSEYMMLVAFHSKVYSMFGHLDEAERVILRATGIPQNDIETIIKSVTKEETPKLQNIAKSVSNSKISKTKVAPHIALSLIYNILGDSINLRKEQQLMMDRSNSSNWVLTHAMGVYGVRGTKEEGNGIIHQIQEEIIIKGENRKNQLQLTHYLSKLGRFEEAEIITDKYLALDAKDVEFLSMKFNIEMSRGNLERMRELKQEILEINPKAFDK